MPSDRPLTHLDNGLSPPALDVSGGLHIDAAQSPNLAHRVLARLPALDSTMPLPTPEGSRSADQLAPGDCLVTRENEAVPLRAIVTIRVRALGDWAPVEIGTGVFGASAALRLSRRQELLFEGWRAEQACGRSAAIFEAGDLINGTSVRSGATGAWMHYSCALLDRSAMIRVNGLWVTCAGLDTPHIPAALCHALPGPDPFGAHQHMSPALPRATSFEARAITGAHPHVW